MTLLTGAEAQVDAVLAAFEPEGAAATEDLEARLEATRGWLEVFARKVAEGVPVHLGTCEVLLPRGRLGAGG